MHAYIGWCRETKLSFERAVRILGSALDVILFVELLEYRPNHRKCDVANVRKGDSKFEANSWLPAT